MKHLQRIDEAVGSITERRVSAEALLKDVVKGNTTEVEGIKMSKAMADAYLYWMQQSTYGKKFSGLPFYKLFSASFNWGIDRYIDKGLKAELKELKAKAKTMKEAKELNEANQSWNDIAKVMDAGLKKAIKSGSVPLSYAKDYVKSLERMAKKSKKKFFDEYGNFSEDDFIEDVEYNIANENKVNLAEGMSKGAIKKSIKVIDKQIDSETGGDGEALDNETLQALEQERERLESMLNESKDFEPHMMYDPETGEEYKAEKPEDHERMAKLGYVHEKPESVDEAKFVKSYDTKVNDAESRKDILKVYPKAKFFVGKITHFFGELEPNLFFKAYYAKYLGATYKPIKGEFKITSVYSKKGSKYVELMNESEINEAAPKMKKNEDAIYLQDLMNKVANAQKGGSGSRYGKEFDKSKTKALRALKDMVMYSNIGI